jgi:steroid delta-isomerase-like uncharacterized protein
MPSYHQKILEEALEEVWSQGREASIERYYHRDYVGHFPPPTGEWVGVDALRADLIELRGAFPDFREECHAMIGDDDIVTARITLRGTQHETYQGHPSLGRSFEIATIDIYRFHEDKIVEQWGVMDELGMIGQLGWVAE